MRWSFTAFSTVGRRWITTSPSAILHPPSTRPATRTKCAPGCPVTVHCQHKNKSKHGINFDLRITMIIIKIKISSIVIGLKNSYFLLIHLPNCYRTVCYRTACYRTVCYRTFQQTNQIQSCSLNQPITFKVVL